MHFFLHEGADVFTPFQTIPTEFWGPCCCDACVAAAMCIFVNNLSNLKEE